MRAYRRVLQQSRRNGRVPGAKFNLPLEFDFAPINPPGWAGNTAAIMQAVLLPFEQREQEQAKEAA